MDQFLSQVETLQDLPYEMLSAQAAARLTQAFKLFDKNGDGKLDDAERAAMIQFVKAFEERRAEPKRDR